ncbi:MAG: redoxin domain-containing protein [Caldilineales bacterium]|nr:redoxin domain-containing protein [Caldilineales bacterium]
MAASSWRSFPDLNTAPPAVRFRLPGSRGRPVAWEDYRWQWGLCLLFLPDGNIARWRPSLEALAEAAEALAERDAAALAVLPTDVDAVAAAAGRLSRPLTLLADADGQVRRRYLSLAPELPADAAFAFLLDRWGAPLAAGAVGDPHDQAWIGEALGWFDLAQARCPE